MHHPNTLERLNLIFLGDQTSNVSSLLKTLLLDSPHSVVQSEFIRDAGAALRAQSDRLRPFQREYLPSFENIHDLARIYQESNGACHPSISSALLCVTQLLQIFRYYEGQGRRVRNNNDVSVVGLCIGSLVAAAYAACDSIDDLRLLGAPTVSMAFQIGLQAATASSMLHEQGMPLESWSISIPRMTEDEVLSALKVYDASGHLSLRHRCFVSAVGVNSVTVSGSPPSLTRFAESLTSSKPESKIRWLPVYAAYHAAHVHSVLDFSSFLHRCGIHPDLLASFTKRKTLISPLTGQPVDASNALGLFKTVVHHTLQAPLRLDLIVEECVSRVNENGTTVVKIDVIGPTLAADSLVASLKARTGANVYKEDLIKLASVVDEYRPSASFTNAPLAIVGVSGRFPGADGVGELWKLLESGLDMHRKIPKDRFDVDDHVDSSGKKKNTSWTPYGCFIDKPGEFDPRFFNMSPREALQTDPMQRLALVTAYEALEMSGFVPNRTRSTALNRVGTFYGQTSDDYRDVNAAQDIGTYFITGGIRAFGPGRINYYFKFGGPSYSIDTACSSSLAAIQLACSSLWSGDCDTAVAGGMSVLTSPDLYAGLSRGQFLSQTGSCKTFDNGADGYCRADGIGSVVIKRLADADLDNDNILAVVLGAATNHSANAVSITHPHAETQSSLYREILQQSGVDPLDVGYVEMHGTGTQAGDGTEMRSVVEVFAPARPTRNSNNPLYVGSIKANIGHGEASSGVAALIKSILIFQNGSIPPHVGIKNGINQGFPDLKARNVRIPLGKTPYQSNKGRKRSILVNNFSAAGGNTALLIQEPPKAVACDKVDPRPLHVVTVSGHTTSALKKNLQRLIEYLSVNPEISPGDLSYTTTARRNHHGFRFTVTEDTVERIRLSLENKRDLNPPLSTPRQSKSAVFVFTGQGTTYTALAQELYATSTQFQADIDHFDGIAKQQGFASFLPLVDGSVADLSVLSTIQVQIGLVCVQVALARLWSSWGIKPSAVIGHSLGEYAALQVSGVLSISDTIFIVGYRARLLESRCEMYSHSMLAVGESSEHLRASLTTFSEHFEISCLNSSRETVFAGERGVIDRLETHLSALQIRSTKLQVPFAFHSSQVDPILDDLQAVASAINLGVPRVPIISPVLGRPLGPDERLNATYIRHHCRKPVNFSVALEKSRQQGLISDSTVLIEIGPHPICLGMIKGILGEHTELLATLRRKENPWKVIAASLASLHDLGFTVNWSEYHRDFEKTLNLINLPVYAFDNKNYWIEYRNAWTLRKGDPLPTVFTPDKTVEQAPRLSESVHRVVDEQYSFPESTVVYESDLWSPQLHTAISGHRVNGSALCPSSVYADMALTVANHIQKNPKSEITSIGINVTSMHVTQPLVIKDNAEETRVLRINARLNRVSRDVKIEYTSLSPGQETETKHAVCVVEYGSADKWLQQWTHNLHLVQERIGRLEASAETGNVSRLTRRLTYKLFSSFMDYTPQYQRMDQVLLSSSTLEASAKVSLEDKGHDTAFFCSPYWIDSLAHISGFVMNSNDSLDQHDAVYISHGWEGMRFAEPLQVGEEYQTYVKMLPMDKTMVGGNVWILHDGRIIGLIEDLKFQRVPRAALDMLIPPTDPTRRRQKEMHGIQPPQVRSTPLNPPKLSTTQQLNSHSEFKTNQRTSLLSLIASALGMAISEISHTDSLSHLGVDSLMSLTLAGTLREKFAVDVHHSHFLDCSTVGHLLDVLEKEVTGSTNTLVATTTTNEPGLPVQMNDYKTSKTSSSSSTCTIDDFTPDSNSAEAIYLVRSIILEETGLTEEDLQPTAELMALGVDSLMGLAILGKLREIDIDLPMDFFMENRTMEEIVRALSGDGDASTQHQSTQAPRNIKCSADVHVPASQSKYHANAILLQRRSNPSSIKRLFLFPDGSGSPSSYASLKGLNRDFDVHGLVCPYVTYPGNYTAGIEAVVQIYLSSIREHQPRGPYFLGGWSVGGILAYEASRQLLAEGEEVKLLLLLDAPCPNTLPPMSRSLIDFLNSVGVFDQIDSGNSVAPYEKRQLILDHFESTVKNLSLYKPPPIEGGTAQPKVLVLWAQNGVCANPGDPRPDVSAGDTTENWILDDRTDFGPCGWDKLLPVSSFSTASVPGNHFTMMQGSNVHAVSGQIEKMLSTLT